MKVRIINEDNVQSNVQNVNNTATTQNTGNQSNTQNTVQQANNTNQIQQDNSDTQQNKEELNKNNPGDNLKQVQDLKNQIIQCQQKIANAEKQFNAVKTQMNNNIIQLNKKIAEFNGSISPTSESYGYKYSKKLFESFTDGPKVSEMTSLLKYTSDELPNLSASLDETRCRTFARDIINKLGKYKQTWERNADHWDDFEEILRNKLTNGETSFSKNEIDIFVDKFKNTLSMSPVFSWIFGIE